MLAELVDCSSGNLSVVGVVTSGAVDIGAPVIGATVISAGAVIDCSDVMASLIGTSSSKTS